MTPGDCQGPHALAGENHLLPDAPEYALGCSPDAGLEGATATPFSPAPCGPGTTTGEIGSRPAL